MTVVEWRQIRGIAKKLKIAFVKWRIQAIIGFYIISVSNVLCRHGIIITFDVGSTIVMVILMQM